MDLDHGASSFVTPSRFDKASLASESARRLLRTGCVPSWNALHEGTLVKRDAEVKSRKPVEELDCCQRRNQACDPFQRDQCGQKFGIAHAPCAVQAVGFQPAATYRDGEHVLINSLEQTVWSPTMATSQELWRKDLYYTARATPEMRFGTACEAATASVCSNTVVKTFNAAQRRQEAQSA